jgi:5'-methylthioadenosine phosphorylase
LRKEFKPMDIAFPDQFFDRTRQRPSTFFGDGIVAHVSMAHPVCGDLCDTLEHGCQSRIDGN